MRIGPIEIKRFAEKVETKSAGSRGREHGISGNKTFLGYNSSGEYLRKLEGQAGRLIFDEMRRSDPQIKSVINAILLPIRRAGYSVDPPEESGQEEMAEIIQKNLMEEMTMTWDDTLRHALLSLSMGFSILEKCWQIRDGKLHIRKLAPRLPISVTKWQYNNGDLVGPVQEDENGKEYLLPIEKILVFTTEKEGDNWEGVSILRGAYKPWTIKDRLEKVNAIKHERYGVGVPYAQYPAAGISDDDKDELETALEAISSDEKSWIATPDTVKVEILSPGNAAGTDILPSIKYCDEAISKSSLAMFVNLGTTETGSRALGGSFIDIFMKSLNAYADYICEVFNRFLIREYVILNWGEQEEYPKLVVSEIKDLDADVLTELAKAGLITADDMIEEKLRDVLHLPEMSDETGERKTPAEKDESKEDVEEEEEEDEIAASEFAELPDEIDFIDIPAIGMKLDAETASIETLVMAIKEKQTADLIRQTIGGISINRLRVIDKKEMHEILMRSYKKMFKSGQADVEKEVRLQRPDMKLSDAPTIKKYLAIMEEEFGIMVEGGANLLKSMVAEATMEYRRQGLSGMELTDAVDARMKERVSDRTWQNMIAGAVNKGYGAGRDVKMNTFSDEIDHCYYSALLDGNACSKCLPKDGHTHALDDNDYITPNPDCDGGPRCRCMTICVMKSESAQE